MVFAGSSLFFFISPPFLQCALALILGFCIHFMVPLDRCAPTTLVTVDLSLKLNDFIISHLVDGKNNFYFVFFFTADPFLLDNFFIHLYIERILIGFYSCRSEGLCLCLKFREFLGPYLYSLFKNSVSYFGNNTFCPNDCVLAKKLSILDLYQ